MAAFPAASHREVPVKVTAWVDKDVAPLVVALNELDGVVTFNSCADGREREAYVLLRCIGADPTTLARSLASALSSAADFRVRAEWRPGVDEPVIELACPRGRVSELAALLSAARAAACPDPS